MVLEAYVKKIKCGLGILIQVVSVANNAGKSIISLV